MIEGVKGLKYAEYVPLEGQSKIDVDETMTELFEIDRQEVFSQVKEYIYTHQEVQGVEGECFEFPEGVLDLKAEEMYELFKKGLDIEQLTIQEVAYQSVLSRKGIDEEADSKEKENKNPLDKEKTISQKIELIKKQNDAMYLYSLTNKESITINSLYEANFKGDFKKGIRQYTKEDVNHVLNMNGLTQTTGNTWATGLLMMYDMGVSAQNITKLQNIQSAVKSIDTLGSGGISGDEALMQGNEVQYKPEYIERITDDLGMVTDEYIEKLIEEGKEVHITELRESIHKKASEVLKEHESETFNEQEEVENSVNVAEQVQEVKKQIHQIRTKLTAEAAQKISGQMPLESSQLSEVANALQQMEQEEVIKALKVVDLPVTSENMDAVSQVMGVAQEMSHYFIQTVQIEMATEGQALLSDIQNALNVYQANETPVEKRFGETVVKVEEQMSALLERQDIEISQVTLEAAKALIMNEVEVNAENIENLQEVVIKLNTFLEEITPIQVATWIKEGINPYRSSVDDLLSWMGDQKVEGLKNSVAETIVVMEKEGQITEEQKQGMIGLYRILQGVSRQKEEIIGYLYKNNLPLTLENLQIAIYYAGNKKHMEIKIDDHFGELESLTYDKQTSKKLIDESMEQSEKILEEIKVLEKMELPIREGESQGIAKLSAWLYPYIKEQFKNTVGQLENIKTLPDSFLEKLESAKHIKSELVEYMVEQKIPLTLSNLYWMDRLTKEPSVYGELLAGKDWLEEEIPADLEELERRLNELQDKASEKKEEATVVGNLKEYKEYKQIEEVIHFQKERMEKEGLYQIPMIIEGERRLINLYFHKEEEKGEIENETHLKAVLTYDTKYLGEIKAYIELKGDVIGYKVETESANGTKALERYGEVLLEKLKHIGYNVQYNEFVDKTMRTKQQDIKSTKYQESLFEKMI